MWQVSILFEGAWWGVGPNYSTKSDAEWAIANWKQTHGTNGTGYGFRVDQVKKTDTPMDEVSPPLPTVSGMLVALKKILAHECQQTPCMVCARVAYDAIRAQK